MENLLYDFYPPSGKKTPLRCFTIFHHGDTVATGADGFSPFSPIAPETSSAARASMPRE
jgi:hypothetical protein